MKLDLTKVEFEQDDLNTLRDVPLQRTNFIHALSCGILPTACYVPLKFKSIMFKIGQKVVCVNEENQVNFSILGKLNPVKKDYIYTIRKIDSVGGLIFEEFIQGYYFDGEEAGFNHERFKPLQDNWVDELLSKIMSEVEADELVSA